MVSLHKNEEEQKKQKIRMEVRTAFLRHKEALQEVEALKLSVRQAQENYRIMQNRYLNQLAILTDLLDANSVLLNAELQLTNTRTHVIYTYYQLQKACGQSLKRNNDYGKRIKRETSKTKESKDTEYSIKLHMYPFSRFRHLVDSQLFLALHQL